MAKVHKHVLFDGLDISIEVPAGGNRTGINKDGTHWEMPITAHYGYIKQTHSPDGEHLDVYLAKNPKKGKNVYVIHQLTPDGKRYDEDKVMVGFTSREDAVDEYKRNSWKPSKQFGAVSELTMDHFQAIAFMARKSTAILATEESLNKLRDKGVKIPRTIKSPIQLSKIVTESEDFDKPLIKYSSRTTHEHAMEVVRQTGIKAKPAGRDIVFDNAEELESFIDHIDYYCKEFDPHYRELLGDLKDALPESVEEIMRENLKNAIEEIERLGEEANVELIAESYGLNAQDILNASGKLNKMLTESDSYSDIQALELAVLAGLDVSKTPSQIRTPTVQDIRAQLSDKADRGIKAARKFLTNFATKRS